MSDCHCGHDRHRHATVGGIRPFKGACLACPTAGCDLFVPSTRTVPGHLMPNVTRREWVARRAPGS